MDTLHDRVAAPEDDHARLSMRMKEEIKAWEHMGRQYQQVDRLDFCSPNRVADSDGGGLFSMSAVVP